MVEDYLNKLESKNYVNQEMTTKYGYVDFIIKGPLLSSTYNIHEILPSDFTRGKDYISNTPGIPLSDSDHIYYCRANIDIVKRLLKDPDFKELYVADSWNSLFEMDVPYWAEVFEVETKRVDSEGNKNNWRGKFSEITNADEIKNIYVPVVFSGDDLPELHLKDWHLDKIYSLINEPIPTELEVTIQAVNEELIKYLSKNPKQLYNLKPRQFEELICEILKSFGWNVELTPATRDGGYDIFAISNTDLGINSSWLVECKKYAEHRKVGINYVRAICGLKNEKKVANAMVATTSFFTNGVEKYKNSRYDLQLADYNKLIEWMNTKFKRDTGSGLFLPNTR